MCFLTSQTTEIAKYACEPRLQVLPAEDALAKQYLEQKSFGDLMTADHKVLNEEVESRNNHLCAVVVQDLATQWIQSFRCKTKTSQETERSLRKFLEPFEKPKSHLFNLANLAKIYHGITELRHLIDPRHEWYC